MVSICKCPQNIFFVTNKSSILVFNEKDKELLQEEKVQKFRTFGLHLDNMEKWFKELESAQEMNDEEYHEQLISMLHRKREHSRTAQLLLRENSLPQLREDMSSEALENSTVAVGDLLVIPQGERELSRLSVDSGGYPSEAEISVQEKEQSISPPLRSSAPTRRSFSVSFAQSNDLTPGRSRGLTTAGRIVPRGKIPESVVLARQKRVEAKFNMSSGGAKSSKFREKESEDLDAIEMVGSILIEGWIWKKAPKGVLGLKVWQRRYVVITDRCLYMFKTEKRGVAWLGKIPMASIQSIRLQPWKKDGRRFDVVVKDRTRIYSFQTETKQFASVWVDKLRSCVSKYRASHAEEIKEREMENVWAKDNAGDSVQEELKMLSFIQEKRGTIFSNDPVEKLFLNSSFSSNTSFDSEKEKKSVSLSTRLVRSESSPIDLQKPTETESFKENLFSSFDVFNADQRLQRLQKMQGESTRNLRRHGSPMYNWSLSQFTTVKSLGESFFGKLSAVKNKNASSGEPDYFYLIVLDPLLGDSIVENGLTIIQNLSKFQLPFLPKLFALGEERIDKKKWAVVGPCLDAECILHDRGENSQDSPDSYLPTVGNLFQYLHFHKRFPEKVTNFIAVQVVTTIAFLHRSECLIQALCPDNIHLDTRGFISLQDLRFCLPMYKSKFSKYSSMLPEYTPPEYLQGVDDTKAADWYRLGCFLYELMTGVPPFRFPELKTSILNDALKFPPWISEKAKDIISKLLKRDRNERLGSKDDFEEVCNHPWFEGTRWNDVCRKQIIPDSDIYEILSIMKNTKQDKNSLKSRVNGLMDVEPFFECLNEGPSNSH